MAKIKCAKCGHIFAVTAIDEIQICPVCNQKMRVKPGAAAGNDEYASLRNEYMRLAREKRETRSGVYLTIDQYNQLIRQADVGAAALTAPQSNGVQPQPIAAPQQSVATTAVDPSAYYNSYYGAPAQPAVAKPQAKPAKLTKGQTIMNWITFGIVLIAAIFAGLMLVFSTLKDGYTGWEMLTGKAKVEGIDEAVSIYNPLGLEGSKGWLLQMLTGIVIFLPIFLMIVSLFNTLAKGKVCKFILAPFMLIAGVLIWIFPYLFSYAYAVNIVGMEVQFNFMDMLMPTADLGLIIWVAAIMCVVAFLMLIIGGAMIPSKKKRIKLAEKQAANVR